MSIKAHKKKSRNVSKNGLELVRLEKLTGQRPCDSPEERALMNRLLVEWRRFAAFSVKSQGPCYIHVKVYPDWEYGISAWPLSKGLGPMREAFANTGFKGESLDAQLASIHQQIGLVPEGFSAVAGMHFKRQPKDSVKEDHGLYAMIQV